MAKPRVLDNDAFVTKYANALVKKYARKTIVICQGEVFCGLKAIERARHKFPESMPMLFSVPPREMFQPGFVS